MNEPYPYTLQQILIELERWYEYTKSGLPFDYDRLFLLMEEWRKENE